MFALLFFLYTCMAVAIFKGRYTITLTLFFSTYLVCLVWLLHHMSTILHLSF